MKKLLLHAVIIIIISCALVSCSGAAQGAVQPEDFELRSDYIAVLSNIPEYWRIAELVGPSFASSTPEAMERDALGRSDDELPSKTISFKGEEYRVTFRWTSVLSLQNYTYNVYTCGSYADSNLTEFHIASEEDGEKLVGFRHRVNASELPQVGTKTEAELIEIATAELGELTDIGHYAHTAVEFSDETGSYTVWFYNSIGELWLADTSYVELAVDGSVIAAEALPDPALLSAASLYEIDVAAFDSAVKTRIAQVFPDYSCDEDSMLATVTYLGVEIDRRRIAAADDGRMLIQYDVTPQISYDVTYRGEWVEILAAKGEDVHQIGVSRPPVYATVYLTEQ